MKNTIFTLILVFTLQTASAIDCPIVNYVENSEVAELIFIGTVKDLTADSVQFKIYETFKGEVKEDVMVLIPTFFEKLKLDDLWLVYLYKSENGDMVLKECGGAKNFSNPIGLSNLYLPEPSSVDLDENSYQNWMHTNRMIILYDFQMELSYLGRKKLDWKHGIETDNDIDKPLFLLYCIVVINLLLLGLIFLLLLKRR
ncbi:hypothetical protein MM239_14935 [Belliella sp. DSM 111904]|uniref:Tissue inhibitor of metalloproteinase n=1 Tax=Belliella filtrata TaxID=2923435 RepID=A0ABS9V2R4_9BACT|nr:hypothetical protein [Belliella filtrata]MCH7410701.1 hypothetical protein [Belliella filtrata]